MVEHAGDRLDAGLRGDLLGQLRVLVLLHEDGLGAAAPDGGGEGGELLRRRRLARAHAGDHGADDLEPVAVGEVAGAGVVGDELAVLGRDLRHLRA